MSPAISIGQLRQNPTEMIRDVKRGATWVLTDRGEPVADITPHRAPRWREAADVAALFTQLGSDPTWTEDLDRLRDDEPPRNPWEAAR